MTEYKRWITKWFRDRFKNRVENKLAKKASIAALHTILRSHTHTQTYKGQLILKVN